MIWLVTSLNLKERARNDRRAFEAWLSDRLNWYYSRLPSVREVKAFATDIGPSYTIQLWVGFEGLEGFTNYRIEQRDLRMDPIDEAKRSQQDDWWEFIESSLVSELETGFKPA